MSTDLDLFRVYYDPAEIAPAGHRYADYPFAWFEPTQAAVQNGLPGDGPILNDPVKDIVRAEAGHRCIRCGHPFVGGSTPGRWSPCDERCDHMGPVRYQDPNLYAQAIGNGETWVVDNDGWTEKSIALSTAGQLVFEGYTVEAEWRILTTHHLNGFKNDLRWWNLVSLDQRCHLEIQSKVNMRRPWLREHSEWFRPYVAGFYAWQFLGLNLTREETESRLDELLALEHRQLELSE